MELGTKIKLGVGGVFATIIAALWFFGGIIGAIIAIGHDDPWSVAFSLLIPAYGAIYTVIMAFAALF